MATEDGVILEELPYTVDYAKTGRARCRGCQSQIDKGELRMARMVQSRGFDGREAHWYHVACFFSRFTLKNVGDISNFEQLRWEDQELIRKKEVTVGKTAANTKDSKVILKDFVIGYAKSRRSGCQVCEEKIGKDEVRISKKDYDSDEAIKYSGGAGIDKWHHLSCFVLVREELGFTEDGSKLPGYKSLDKKHQAQVKKVLPKIKEKAVKRKLEESSASNGKSVPSPVSSNSKRSKKDDKDELLKKQNQQMYEYNDALGGYSLTDLKKILSSNKQEIPTVSTRQVFLDRITDIMTFGALEPCPLCQTGQFVFRSGVGYQCSGNISEYSKCMNICDEPLRKPFKVPNDFKDLAPFARYKYKSQARILQKIAPTASTSAATATAVTSKLATSTLKSLKINKSPLYMFQFLISTEDSKAAENWKKKIEQFGGKVMKKNSVNTVAVITTEGEFEERSGAIQFAEEHGIPVVKGNFVKSLKDTNYDLCAEITKNLICDWVKDVSAWLLEKNKGYGEVGEGEKKPKEKRDVYEKKEKSVKLVVKDGAVVDPESKLENFGHVLKDGEKRFFNCVLNRTSIEEGRNSYYKQQIIEADHGKSYWVFQGWGRIGTVIGGKKVHEGLSKHEAIEIFCEKFFEQTGNVWGQPFKKLPGLYTMMEVDYGEQEHLNKLEPSSQECALPLSLQELVCMIFDVQRMKQAMMEFELNLEEMPLGKISRKQVLSAYSTLSEVSNLLTKSQSEVESATKRLIRDNTNRFYTLIPHNFGSKKPPMLDNQELLKAKLDMLESLLEIELAYDMLLEGDKGGESSIDAHYKTLDAAIEPVEAGSSEYVMLEKYLKNTHADTHSSYNLEIEHIFQVNRKSEKRRYSPFKSMHNRKLLWHGSRVTNYCGILSQGLRIAPPEAPVTGYMFGKGVYFADMVSKSANYCHTNPDNTSGLLLVCEVALGDMCELRTAKEDLTKAPKNCHSVKGCGQTIPNPDESIQFDGVEVPLGKPVPSKVKSDLLYNEYIVYDVAQVNIRYLIKVDFKFSGRRRF